MKSDEPRGKLVHTQGHSNINAQISEGAPYLIFAHDMDGKFISIIHISTEGFKSCGFTREELTGMNCYKHPIIQEYFKHIEQNRKELFENGYTIYNSTHIFKNCFPILIEICARIFTFDGIELVVCTAFDRTNLEDPHKPNDIHDKTYEALAESSLTGIFVHQFGKYVFINDEFARMHGCTVEEILAMKDRKYTHPNFAKMVSEVAGKSLIGEAIPRRLEVQRVKKDGSIFWCELIQTPTQYNGRPALMGHLIDISERKKNEEALKESEERYRELVESSPVGITIMIDGIIVYMNSALSKILELEDCESNIGKTLIEFVHLCDRDMVMEMIDKLKKVKRIFSTDYRFVQTNGKAVHVEATFVNIIYGGKQAVQIVCKDVTERKVVEDAIKQSEEKYRSIFEQARDGIVLAGKKTGTIFDCNSEFERLAGRDIGQLTKMRIWELASADKMETYKNEFLKVSKIGVGGVENWELQKPDGEYVPIEFLANRVKFRGKEYLQIIVRDIAENKRAEQAVHMAREQYQSLLNYYEQATATLNILQGIVQDLGNSQKVKPISTPLNTRELEILELASKGMSNNEIAKHLSVSERTVGAHFRSIFAKMSVGSRTEAIYKALKYHWISLS